MSELDDHSEHPEVLKRLKRAQGHLVSIIAMLETGRPCMDVALQLLAVEKAVANARKVLIHEHIDHCLESTVRDGSLPAEDTLRQFREITRYL